MSRIRQFGQFHGGDETTADRWPHARRPILDLSTGINPHAYRFDAPEEASWCRLPQSDAEGKLKRALADYLGIAETSTLTLAPGSQILINQLPFLFDRAEVSILGPTYNEHVHSWSSAGHDVAVVEQLDGRSEEADIVVITNPNNPDGRVTGRDALVHTARGGGRPGRILIVDEAFADLAPDLSIADLVGELPVIILRSVGKFFGLAGMRVGVMVAHSDLSEGMARRLGPWCVSGPALEVASRAYADTSWIENMRARLKNEAIQLDELLSGCGLDVAGGTALFRLVDHPAAETIYEELGKRGILIRRFDYNPSWLRIGLPPSPITAERLADALKEVMLNV